MPTEDSDDNPSGRRIAAWLLDSADIGLLGILWAIVVGIWARRRQRQRTEQ